VFYRKKNPFMVSKKRKTVGKKNYKLSTILFDNQLKQRSNSDVEILSNKRTCSFAQARFSNVAGKVYATDTQEKI